MLEIKCKMGKATNNAKIDSATLIDASDQAEVLFAPKMPSLNECKPLCMSKNKNTIESNKCAYTSTNNEKKTNKCKMKKRKFKEMINDEMKVPKDEIIEKLSNINKRVCYQKGKKILGLSNI
ncbi:hypothetical protein RFI_01458 [Reticulomyxa filosa]|uniref:Uncharacterized protein n=1 Tax=Reticulomyxa filosa TaxID=46433 RepID=X6PC16_RETFI|nr:hypothetical protein RFI_01458 [Reticulomyxa filosa]|eukprot:ETO35604.1 hypothetical protein RFI_01458 [Reticulomyxa filosa]